MDLCLGKMTNQQLADWFGITLKSYTNNRVKKLDELRWYCDYDVIRGGVLVRHIRHLQYQKNFSKIGQEVREKLPEVWPVGEPHTCAQVGALLFETRTHDGKLETYVYQTRKQRTAMVGRPSRSNPYCHYEVVKAYRGDTEGTTRFEKLTEAEKELQHKIWINYFNDDLDMGLLTSLMADGNDEELARIMKAETKFTESKYKAYTTELAAALHCDYMIRATVITTTWTPAEQNWDESTEEWLNQTAE